MTAVLVEDYMRRLQARGLTGSYHLLTDREKEVLQLLRRDGRTRKRRSSSTPCAKRIIA